jgi:UPF0716 protein FxsA
VFTRLLLLMTVVPAVELYLLLQIGSAIGAAETIYLIIITGIVGAWLAKREGLSVVRKIQEDAVNGVSPGDRLVEGLMVLIGGVLLLTPGVVTDLCGLAMIFPLTRAPLARRTKGWLAARVTVNGVNIGPAQPGPAARQTKERLNPTTDDGPIADRFDHPVQ